MIDKVKKFLSLEEEEYEYSDENDKDSEKEEIAKPVKLNKLKITESEVVISEPLSYSESQSIADYVLANRSMVINLRRVTPDQAKRIIDFLSGTIYAIDGTIQKIGDDIFLLTPKAVNVTGNLEDASIEIE